MTSMRGLRLREVVVLVTGSGIGKSSLVTQITLDLHQQGEVCGMLMLEEANLVTIKKLIDFMLVRQLKTS